MAAIDVEHLHVVRGGATILPDISFAVRAGTIAGLIGPSGSGKSTLIRALVGVQIVESGRVEVLGAPAGDPSLRSRVAYLTQAPSVYGDLTVRENLEYFAQVLGVGGIEDVLETVGLSALPHRVVRTLSGGERSRVSLATALLGRPELLVLDEPTVGLDPILRRDLWHTFRLLADEGRTLLVSSHVLEEAERCDRLILLRGGAIVADESPAALRTRTRTATLDDAFLALLERA